jgi:hypothetical protein
MGRSSSGRDAGGAGQGQAGAARAEAYTAARAAHVVEEFLEERLSLEELERWLRGYPYLLNRPATDDVEDEINKIQLAVQALRHNTRSWDQIHGELKSIRSRLTGLARF